MMKYVLVMISLGCMYFKIYSQSTNEQEVSNVDTVTNIFETHIDSKGESKISGNRIRFDLGFCHYTGDIFRSSQQGKEFSLMAAVQPGIKFLEVYGRYEYTFFRTGGMPGYDEFDGKYAGFASIGIGGCLDFSYKKMVLNLFTNFGPMLIHVEGGQEFLGLSTTYGFDWFFYQGKKNPHLRMGLTVAMHNYIWSPYDIKYLLTEFYSSEKEHLNKEFNIVLGFTLAFY